MLCATANVLSRVSEDSHVGTWAWNVSRREIIYWSAESYRIFGFEPKSGSITVQKVRDRVHPEDRVVFDEAVGMVCENICLEIGFRIVLPDGSVKHIHSTGQPILEDHGRVVRTRFCTHIDLTQRTQAEERLRQSQADLAEAQRVARLGNWILEFGTNGVRWSDELYRDIRGGENDFRRHIRVFLSRVHPTTYAGTGYN